MNVKYQIFVSSTYEDLKDERNEVIKACLNMGHIPVGMEMFNAADEEQWAVISRTIDQCDYYVVIVAHRYGSTVDGVSFTEKEYDYAVEQSVPVLGFVIAEKDVTWPPEWIEKDPKATKALGRFKSKIKKKIIRPWHNASELRALFVESLTTPINLKPRRGWVRAPESADVDIAQALSNLTEENSRLRRELESLRDAPGKSDADSIISALKRIAVYQTTEQGMQERITGDVLFHKFVDGAFYTNDIKKRFPGIPQNQLEEAIAKFRGMGLFLERYDGYVREVDSTPLGAITYAKLLAESKE